MERLDPQHKAFVSDELTKFALDYALEPFPIENGLAQLNDSLCGLLANHEDRVNNHAKQCGLDLLRERLFLNILAQFR